MSDHPTGEEDLRALLHETAGSITTRGTLEDIRTRTERSSTRRWLVPAVAAAVVLGLAVGGTAWVLRDDASTGPSPALPVPTTSATEEPTGTVGPPQPATIYYAGDTARGRGLFAEQHEVVSAEGNPGIPDPLAAVRQAVSGTPADPDYLSLWPAGVIVEGVSFDGFGDDGEWGVLLMGPARDRPVGMSERDAKLAVGAVVRTLQSTMGGRSRVSFYVGEERVQTVLGMSAKAFDAGDDDSVMAPVQITSPAEGADLTAGPIEVTGVAATFEANVVYEVLVGGDAVVDSGFTTAAECCTLAPYSFTLDLEPGSYTLVVHDEDMSGEGRPVNRDTKEIVVR